MILIASEKPWNKNLVDRLNSWSGGKFIFGSLEDKAQLNIETLEAKKVDFIFFPHWSHKIPASVYENVECIVFHMTDLPFGRGGSPLQNLIIRGHKETKVSALRVVEEMDAGDIYLKKPLSLEGTAEEIFVKTDQLIELMIQDILKENIKPSPQKGEVVDFKRRTPEEGQINELEDLKTIFDYIRMLDAPTYPKAYVELDHYRIEFSQAKLNDDESVEANVRIIKK